MTWPSGIFVHAHSFAHHRDGTTLVGGRSLIWDRFLHFLGLKTLIGIDVMYLTLISDAFGTLERHYCAPEMTPMQRGCNLLGGVPHAKEETPI